MLLLGSEPDPILGRNWSAVAGGTSIRQSGACICSPPPPEPTAQALVPLLADDIWESECVLGWMFTTLVEVSVLCSG